MDQVVTAIPLNGGAYNLLLNTTSKFSACIAACLTILSYTATAVVSAASAIEYINRLVTFHPIPATISVLAIFAFLTILGVRESAGVAAFIFVLHVASMFLLAFCGIVFIFSNNGVILFDNFNAPLTGRLLPHDSVFVFVAITPHPP
jgi:amino acid transporter